MLETG